MQQRARSTTTVRPLVREPVRLRVCLRVCLRVLSAHQWTMACAFVCLFVFARDVPVRAASVALLRLLSLRRTLIAALCALACACARSRVCVTAHLRSLGKFVCPFARPAATKVVPPVSVHLFSSASLGAIQTITNCFGSLNVLVAGPRPPPNKCLFILH